MNRPKHAAHLATFAGHETAQAGPALNQTKSAAAACCSKPSTAARRPSSAPAVRYLVVASIIFLVSTLVSPFHPTPKASATHKVVLWRATLTVKSFPSLPLGMGVLGSGEGCTTQGDTGGTIKNYSCAKDGVLNSADPLTRGDLSPGGQIDDEIEIHSITLWRPNSTDDPFANIVFRAVDGAIGNALKNSVMELSVGGISISLGRGAFQNSGIQGARRIKWERDVKHPPHYKAGDKMDLTLIQPTGGPTQHYAGDWDPTFSNNGEVITKVRQADSRIHAMAFQNDKIVAVGQVGNGAESDFALARYNADGSLDLTFGEAGRVVTPIAQDQADVARAVAIQPDGKIVVAGHGAGILSTTTPNEEVVLARYNPDGSLDSTFDSDGIAVFSTDPSTGGNTEIANAIRLQLDGNGALDKIYVAGRFGTGWGVVRFNKNGALDTAGFNSPKGYRPLTFTGGGFSTANAIGFRRTLLIIAGDRNSGGTRASKGDFAIVGLTKLAGLDDTTISHANASTSFTNENDKALSMVIELDSNSDANDRYVLAGYSGGSNENFAITKHAPNGQLDSSFTANGKVSVDFSGNDRAHSIISFRNEAVANSASKYIVGGYTSNNVANNNDFAIAQLTHAGALDTSFASNGKTKTDFHGGHDQINALLRTNKGNIANERIIAGGLATNSNNSNFALVSYKPDGSLDEDFGNAGKVITNFSPAGDTLDEVHAIVVQPDNKIIAAGESKNGDNTHVAVVRYNEDGTPDTSFAKNGRAIITFHATGQEKSRARSLALQDDGKIIVVADAGLTTLDIGVARLNTDGTLDTAFGGNNTGKTTVGFANSAEDSASAVAIQSDDKIIVGGGSSHANMDGDDVFAITLVRFKANGSLDTTFGETASGNTKTGKRSTMIASISPGDGSRAGSAIRHISVDSSGNILAAASTESTGFSDSFILARYNSGGSLDTNFGTSGITITTPNLSATGNFRFEGQTSGSGFSSSSMSLTSDGKYLLGGNVTAAFNFNNNQIIATIPILIAFNSSGAINSEFGNSGIVTLQKLFSSELEARISAITQQNDGRILLGGFSRDESRDGWFIARLLPDGTIDESFGRKGMTSSSFTRHIASYANTLAVDSRGKIVAAGTARTDYVSTPRYFGVARYLDKGTSSTARLSSLQMEGFTSADAASSDGISLTPTFSNNVFSYTAPLAPSIAKVKLTAKGSDANTNIRYRKIGGDWKWALSGEQTDLIEIRSGGTTTNLEIEVLAPDNTSKQKYTISFGPPPNTLSALVVQSGQAGQAISLMPAFDSNATTYTATLPPNDNSVKIRLTSTASSGTTIEAKLGSESWGSAVTVMSGTLSSAFDVGSGSTRLEVRVQVTGNNSSKTYRIDFSPAPLATLTGFSGVLVDADSSETALNITPNFSTSTTSYSSVVPVGDLVVKITPTAAAGTTIMVGKSGTMPQKVVSGAASQIIAINRGDSVEIVASASAKKDNTYTINFKGARSGHAPIQPPAGPFGGGQPPAEVVDNAAPTFDESGPASRLVTENSPANTPVGDPIAASDEDGDTVTYSLVGDSELFAIDSASGQISVAMGAELDFETEPNTYTVTVAATDEDGSGEATQIEVVIDVEDQEVPDSVAAFDKDSDEEISLSELLSALSAYLSEEITVDELLEIIRHYLAS